MTFTKPCQQATLVQTTLAHVIVPSCNKVMHHVSCCAGDEMHKVMAQSAGVLTSNRSLEASPTGQGGIRCRPRRTFSSKQTVWPNALTYGCDVLTRAAMLDEMHCKSRLVRGISSLSSTLGVTIDNVKSLLQKANELKCGHDVQQVKANMVRGIKLDG